MNPGAMSASIVRARRARDAADLDDPPAVDRHPPDKRGNPIRRPPCRS
jgi:hypothetical protein